MSRKKKPASDAEQTLEQTESDAEAIETMEEAVDAADAQTEAQSDNAAAQAKLTELNEALAASNAKADEYLTMAQRVQADFENFRRRNKDVRHEAFEDGARAFATTLLPVLDNLERALHAAADSPDKSLKDGVEMVQRQLSDTFVKRGITAIDRKGEKFDPNLENAVLQGAPEDGEPGTVCEVLQKGYQLDGVVLRHAMVKVVPE